MLRPCVNTVLVRLFSKIAQSNSKTFLKTMKRRYQLKLWIHMHGLPLNPRWTLSLENTERKLAKLDYLGLLNSLKKVKMLPEARTSRKFPLGNFSRDSRSGSLAIFPPPSLFCSQPWDPPSALHFPPGCCSGICERRCFSCCSWHSLERKVSIHTLDSHRCYKLTDKTFTGWSTFHGDCRTLTIIEARLKMYKHSVIKAMV